MKLYKYFVYSIYMANMSKKDNDDDNINDIDINVIENDIMVGEKTNKLVLKNDKKRVYDIFIPCISSEVINISIQKIGGNISSILTKILSTRIEGKCGKNGYVKEGSTKILRYSSGLCKASNIVFNVVYECMVCNPVKGMNIECIVKNITKAGIRAELDGYKESPIIIFIARDHHYSNKYFNDIEEKDLIKVNVIGQRFELNDKYVSVIAEIDTKKRIYNKKQSTKTMKNN